MDSANHLKGLFKKLSNENNFVGGDGGGHTQLTPHLALVVSIIYMMVADGEISDQESSQLQSVIGNNETVIKKALQYVETTKIEQFLKDVPSVLDSQDSLCILMNVCDSIMADGQFAELEMKLFERMTSALGHSRKSFRSYFNTISIKNKKSVLGSFDILPASDQLTPQLALAASMLYMMSADGSMAEEEIGQLNVVIGRSDGLLQAGLKYVKTIKFQQFIKEAAAVLNTAQQLCILTNVCDSMMSDGEVAAVEVGLFRRMLTAFNFSEEKFQPFFNILSRKNKKPEEKKGEDNAGGFIPAHTKKTEKNGFSYDRKLSLNDNNTKAPAENVSTSNDDDEIGDPTKRSELGIIINRKMQDNIDKMSESIEGKNGIQDITDNANSNQGNEEQAIKKHIDKKAFAADKAARKETVHFLDSDSLEDSVQYLDEVADQDSVHYLDKDASQDSMHYLDKDAPERSVHFLDDAAKPNSTHYLANGKASGADNGNTDLSNTYARTGLKAVSKHKNTAGPLKPHGIKASRSLIPGKPRLRKEKSLSDLRAIVDTEGEIDRPPLVVRMTVVQTRTIEINQTFDKLDSVGETQFYQRGLILSTIKFSPAAVPTPFPDTGRELAFSILVNNPISILHNEVFSMAANNPALQNGAIASGIDELKVKIAGLFTVLLIAYGFSSVGESAAQSDFILKENLATQAHISLQAVVTQKTMYKLAADDLDASLLRKDSLNNEQQESAKSKLDSYLKKIAEQETAAETGDGKKELAAARKAHEEVAAIDSTMIQWFVLSKAFLLLGIGLSLCGFIFTSRFIVYGASLTAVLGTLLTLNGYFLFV